MIPRGDGGPYDRLLSEILTRLQLDGCAMEHLVHAEQPEPRAELVVEDQATREMARERLDRER